MEAREKFLEICKIFNETIEAEVRKYFKRNDSQSDSDKSKITFYNIKGDMLFLDKYQLVGDGDGGNEVLSNINGRKEFHDAPTFIIPEEPLEESKFWLYLEHPNSVRYFGSYFIKETRDNTRIYRLDGEAMLESEDFKKCILQMFEDIAPERLEEIRKLVS